MLKTVVSTIVISNMVMARNDWLKQASNEFVYHKYGNLNPRAPFSFAIGCIKVEEYDFE